MPLHALDRLVAVKPLQGCSVRARRALQVAQRCRAFGRRVFGGIMQKKLYGLPFDGWPSDYNFRARVVELMAGLEQTRRKYVACYKTKCAALRDLM